MTLDLAIPSDKFSIDSIPTRLRKRVFSGEDEPLVQVRFVDPETQVPSFEQGVSLEMFSFNGTTIAAPATVNENSTLDVHDIREDQLEGELLIVEMEEGVAYGEQELRRQLPETGSYIILLKTGLMDEVMQVVKDGKPDYDRLDEIHKRRPGISMDGARYLARIGIAKVIAIDHLSFERADGIPKGLMATQIMMNRNEELRTFVPIIYHASRTTTPEFAELAKRRIHARIELGNVPDHRPLPNYPCSFKVRPWTDG